MSSSGKVLVRFTAVASVCEPIYEACLFTASLHKFMIFDHDCYLISDIESALLPDILDPVDKLPGNTFISQFIGYGNIKGNGKFAIIGNLPAGNIFGDYLNIFGSKNYLLSVNSNWMISVIFKCTISCGVREEIALLISFISLP